MMIAEKRHASEVNNDEGFLEYACETGQTARHSVGRAEWEAPTTLLSMRGCGCMASAGCE